MPSQWTENNQRIDHNAHVTCLHGCLSLSYLLSLIPLIVSLCGKCIDSCSLAFSCPSSLPEKEASVESPETMFTAAFTNRKRLNSLSCRFKTSFERVYSPLILRSYVIFYLHRKKRASILNTQHYLPIFRSFILCVFMGVLQMLISYKWWHLIILPSTGCLWHMSWQNFDYWTHSPDSRGNQNAMLWQNYLWKFINTTYSHHVYWSYISFFFLLFFTFILNISDNFISVDWITMTRDLNM